MQPKECVRTLVRDDAAQDLIEYALLAGLIALATVTATQALGDTLLDTFWSRIAGMLTDLV
jgi:Flp pilus assembly pilin Flp